MIKRVNKGPQEEIRKRIISEYKDQPDANFLSVKYDVHPKSFIRMVKTYNERKSCKNRVRKAKFTF